MTSNKTSTKKPIANINTNWDITEDWQTTFTQENSTHNTNNGTPTLDRQCFEILDDITQTQLWLDYHYHKKSNALRVLRENLHHITMQANIE